MTTFTPISSRWKTGAAALLSVGVLLAAVVPVSAVGMPPRPAPAVVTQDRTESPREMMALAEQPREQAMAYCASRFRSYDPTTGTYLGYDGDEHACP